MRKIYIRLKDFEKLNYRRGDHGRKGELSIIVYGKRTKDGMGQILLVNPTLRRRIVGGVYFIDQWGNRDKWFTEERTSTTPLW